MKARENLIGVDYLFINEIFMLSLYDIYHISEQLCKTTGVIDKPFGGLNIILAGDLAQLPPFRNKKLWQDVGLTSYANMSGLAQKEAIAKAIWHQFTTMVILKKNMRQNVQSENDAKLRKTLENMRYAACKSDDIAYLEARIAGCSTDQPDLSATEFQYASIITSRNTQRDRLNEMGCKRFATEMGQKLHAFYSYDVIGSIETPNPTRT